MTFSKPQSSDLMWNPLLHWAYNWVTSCISNKQPANNAAMSSQLSWQLISSSFYHFSENVVIVWNFLLFLSFRCFHFPLNWESNITKFDVKNIIRYTPWNFSTSVFSFICELDLSVNLFRFDFCIRFSITHCLSHQLNAQLHFHISQ